MYTRCFERENFNGTVDTINISEYGFEWYIDSALVRTGLVENIDDDIASLLNEGFEEVA